MTDELIKKLLEAGVHFGHQTRRWNPKMKKYIFGERSGIYIIDLEKTVDCLNRARDFLHDNAAQGRRILFVGTKRQAQDIVAQEATRAGMFFIRNRWLGGLLTNFQTVRKSIERLKSIERMSEDGTFDELTKKERARLSKERDKLQRDLEGIREMNELPDVVFIIDSKREEIAVREANRLKIPTVGLIDTNCDPDHIDLPIPGNDDALKSIRFIVTMLTDNILEGKKAYVISEQARRKEADEQSDAGESGQKIEEEIETLEDSTEKKENVKRGPTKVRMGTEKEN